MGTSVGYLRFGGAVGKFDVPNGTRYSIILDQLMLANAYHAFSDKRAKDIQQISNTGEDLNTLLKLQVTDYKHIDTVQNGSKVKKGFIAQQVESVYPEAVTQLTNFIPNIFSAAVALSFDQKRHYLTITLGKPHYLKVGDIIQIHTKDQMIKKTIVAVESDNVFCLDDWESEPDELFVYGKQVDDYRTVDYDSIFTLAVSALQEQHRIIQSQQETIAKITGNLQQVMQRLEVLENDQ
ncbi:MAG: tail fiber domain-containing protein [Moorea sp. SIO3G5]|nr:tail fiber domain-containing protein [Moorena sp. SIO3G5]